MKLAEANSRSTMKRRKEWRKQMLKGQSTGEEHETCEKKKRTQNSQGPKQSKFIYNKKA